VRRTIARRCPAGVLTAALCLSVGSAAPARAAVASWSVDTAWSSTNTGLTEQTTPTPTVLADDLDAQILPGGSAVHGLALDKLAESVGGGGLATAGAGFGLSLSGPSLTLAGDTLAQARTADSTTVFPLTANASAAYRVLLTLTLTQAATLDFSAQLSTRASTTQFNLTAITGSLSEPVAGTLTSNVPTPPFDRDGLNVAGSVELAAGIYQLDVTGVTVLAAPSDDGPDLLGGSSINLLLDLSFAVIPEPAAAALTLAGAGLLMGRRLRPAVGTA
jgi:hypothetical protein